MKKIKFLVLWVGTTCTLKCENCCNLIPYSSQDKYSIQVIVDNLRYITQYVSIEKLQIQGGEPLTCKDLYRVVEACEELPIAAVDIASNGTIIPDDILLEALGKLGERASFHISNYSCVDEKKKIQVEAAVKRYGISFNRYDFLYGDGAWFDSGKADEPETNDPILVQKSYYNCENRFCWVLAQDFFACCGKIITLMKIKKCGVKDLEVNNIINISKARELNNNFRVLLDEFDNNYKTKVPSLCRFCKVEKDRIPAGIQMK